MGTERESRQPHGDAAHKLKDKSAGLPLRNYVAVARGRDLVVIRVVGRGTMLNAPALQEFADEQRRAGFIHFLFDFERCEGLDSTFMGVMVGMYTTSSDSGASSSGAVSALAVGDAPTISISRHEGELEPMSPEEALASLAQQGFGTAPKPAEKESRSSTVSAVNSSMEVRSLLAMLGVDKFVKLRGSCDLSKLETTILPEKAISPIERQQLILKAHEQLVEIDKRNEAQFGELLKMLSAELAGK